MELSSPSRSSIKLITTGGNYLLKSTDGKAEFIEYPDFETTTDKYALWEIMIPIPVKTANGTWSICP